MELWDVGKFVLIGFLALPLLFIPLGIYSILWFLPQFFGNFKDRKVKLEKIVLTRKTITIILVFVVVVGWGIRENMNKNMYSQHISHEISSEYKELADNILKNNYLYEEILRKKRIELWQLNSLIEQNESLSQTYEKYWNVASNFKRIDSDMDSGTFASDIRDISRYFFSLQTDILIQNGYENNDNLDLYTILPVDEETLEKIDFIYQLNQPWVVVILMNIEGTSTRLIDGKHINSEIYYSRYGDRTLKDDLWVDVLIQLSEANNRFGGRLSLTGY